jgi:holo-[acyl-carrier protein] synthase
MSIHKELTTGVDIIEIDRIQRVVTRWGNRFLERIYTPGELTYCEGKSNRLAARFAAKEAVMKALGTGTSGIGWREVEITRKPSGAPNILLHGRALRHASTIGIQSLALSLSHSRAYAVVSVVGSLT